MISFRQTRQNVRFDKEQLALYYQHRGVPLRYYVLSPSFLCVYLYRISQYLYGRKLSLTSRLVWQVNVFLTGADISPMCNIGPGFVVVHPYAVTIVGNAGSRFTVEGLGGMGGGMIMDDRGAGPGLPLLGDDVTLERGAMVLGPIVVGNAVNVGPGLTIVSDVPDNSQVLPHKVKVITSKATP